MTAQIIRFPGHRVRRPVVIGGGYMTKHQAASYLCVTTRTVERWQHEGLPYHRVGGKNLYRRAELDEWVESRT